MSEKPQAVRPKSNTSTQKLKSYTKSEVGSHDPHLAKQLVDLLANDENISIQYITIKVQYRNLKHPRKLIRRLASVSASPDGKTTYHVNMPGWKWPEDLSKIKAHAKIRVMKKQDVRRDNYGVWVHREQVFEVINHIFEELAK